MTKQDEAWLWYTAAKAQLGLMRRLADRHWAALESVESLWRDEPFKQLDKVDVQEQVARAVDPLEDLAVVVLFSTFEEAVREYVAIEIDADRTRLQSTYLRSAAAAALEGVKRGSFYRVLEGLKQPGWKELIDQVDQVRDYRNWVAHGRSTASRDELKAKTITAQDAYRRLKTFLDALYAAAPPSGS